MYKNSIKHTSTIMYDEYVQFIYDKLDIQPSTERIVEIPLNTKHPKDYDFEWNIGLVCGNSGSGKTSILYNLGSVKPILYDYNKSVISQFEQFHLSPQQASDILFNVGLSSIPTWLNSPQHLSNGEKARLDIAMQLAMAEDGEIVYIDEWTSVVNRDVAKSMSNSIQKYIRKHNLKVVFFSCHFDIINWLQCDWIYNLNKTPCEIECLVYSDDEEYNVYHQVSSDMVLSNEYSI